MTRKLTIRTKLAATLAVPLVALAAFSALQVRESYETADRVKRQTALATSATGPSGIVDLLLTERDYETLRVVGLSDAAKWLGVKNSRQAQTATDRKIGEFRNQLKSLPSDVAGQYNSIVSKLTNELDGDVGLRAQIEELASNVGPENAKSAAVVFDGYTALITQLLDADQKSGARVDDAEMRSGVELLNTLNRQTELESRIVVKTVLARLANDPVQALDVQRLGALQQQGERDLQVRADGVYTNDMRKATDAKARTDALAKLRALTGSPLDAKPQEVLALPPDLRLLRTAISNVGGAVSERSTELSTASQNEQRNLFTVTIGSVLLAIVLLWLTNRWITRPLKSLADQAATMAGETLPNAVREILDTPPGQEVVQPEIEPVHVQAGGEVREVEAALNRVQDSAIALAVEQAQLRGNVADAFVNLGRRNQNLLSRQLEYITHLENDESDPETLEHLFRLDHLATRMRRNAESLLVLAGHEPPRTWSAPVEIGDVVRGALGEVEGYQRVKLPHIDDARVDGAAAVDVSHVIAELVENALAFSPPDTDVEVYGRMDEAGYVVTIVDEGIGMPAEDLARANALISSADARTFAPSRFLGHYVVAQLAARHNLQVYLADSPAGGITASVLLPPALVGGETEAPPVAVPEQSGAPEAEPDVQEVERPAIALPRREAAEMVDVVEPEPEPAPAPQAAPEAEPEPDPFIAFALQSKREPQPAPAPPELAPEVAPPAPTSVPESVAFAALAEASRAEVPPAPQPEPEPQPEPVAQAPEPEPQPAPEPPRPRIGVGTFADLRAVPETPAPKPAPAPASEPAPVAEAAPLDAPAPPPDRAATFAEVATAVDAVTANTTPPAPTPSAFAEDLLPQKLPKRGRKGKKEMVWKRERPATPVVPVDAAPPAAVTPPPSPIAPAASHVVAAPGPNGAAPEPGAVRFGPGGPALAQHDEQEAEAAAERPSAAPPTDQRFAFFAAFRDASHRAREEAGIDDRRGS